MKKISIALLILWIVIGGACMRGFNKEEKNSIMLEMDLLYSTYAVERDALSYVNKTTNFYDSIKIQLAKTKLKIDSLEAVFKDRASEDELYEFRKYKTRKQLELKASE